MLKVMNCIWRIDILAMSRYLEEPESGYCLFVIDAYCNVCFILRNNVSSIAAKLMLGDKLSKDEAF